MVRLPSLLTPAAAAAAAPLAKKTKKKQQVRQQSEPTLEQQQQEEEEKEREEKQRRLQPCRLQQQMQGGNLRHWASGKQWSTEKVRPITGMNPQERHCGTLHLECRPRRPLLLLLHPHRQHHQFPLNLPAQTAHCC
jgi:hypothetical protein